MSVAADTLFAFDNTFVRELEGLYEPWSATPAPAPRLLVVNEALAGELGLDAAAARRRPRRQRLPEGDGRSRRRTPGTSSAASRRGSATGARCCSAR